MIERSRYECSVCVCVCVCVCTCVCVCVCTCVCVCVYIQLSLVQEVPWGKETQRPFHPRCSPATSSWSASCCQRDGYQRVALPFVYVSVLKQFGGVVNWMSAGADVGGKEEEEDGSV